LRKHEKSWTLRTGGTVERSQLAYVSPLAKELRKQEKSWTLRTGAMVELSQLVVAGSAVDHLHNPCF
jgi:hypothetical protein